MVSRYLLYMCSSAEDAIAILSSENRIARNMIFRVNASALHINIINYISLIFTLNLYVIFIRVDCNLYLHVSILKFVLMNMEWITMFILCMFIKSFKLVSWIFRLSFASQRNSIYNFVVSQKIYSNFFFTFFVTFVL